MKSLRVAVIGAGPMGRLHARAVRRRATSVGDCTLSVVVDRHRERSARVAGDFDAAHAAHIDEYVGALDAAIVAVPATQHVAVADQLLDRSLDLLIEKPLAPTRTAAEALVSRARAKGRVIQAGHVEWYNPVLREALREAGEIHRIEVERRQPETLRGLDIDVVQDFMLHDLDWARRVIRSPVRAITGTGSCLVHDQMDVAEVDLEFASGATAHLLANRCDVERTRRVRVLGTGEEIEADLLSGVVTRGRVEFHGEAPVESPSEPLDLQWADFVSACQTRCDPENSGEEALETLALVERVREVILPGRGAEVDTGMYDR